MAERVFKVEVQHDHLSKVAGASPDKALAELIWNSLDADATKVNVYFVDGELGVEEIVISDDGIGFLASEAESLFQSLGGSWKSRKEKTATGRYLHGKEGQGRFKAFSLGRSVQWEVRPKAHSEELGKPFVVTGLADKLQEFRITESEGLSAPGYGVTVRIRELCKNFHILDPDTAISRLLPIFALYLRAYSSVTVTVSGVRLDPSSLIKGTHVQDLGVIAYEGHDYPVELEIIEWRNSSDKELWYCTEKGFPLEKYQKQIRSIGRFGFTAYLKSALIDALNKDNSLGLGELNAYLRDVSDAAVKHIKQYFSERTIEEGQEQIRRWKSEMVYPFKSEASNPVEVAERQVFDIVAVKLVESLPALDQADKQSKAFQLRMLRQAVETNPAELQSVISEVLSLSKEKLEELSLLLQDVSLVGVISASKLVADRLKFLAGLEFLIFDKEFKKNLKERSQLHRIVAENTWIFGHEFAVSVDDQSLTQVLRKHREAKGLSLPIDEPVRRIDGSTGIVDLMLSRAIPCSREDQLEHLVVELKAPKVKIGEAECSQIKSYAFAVIDDERFTSLDATWNFWVISNEMDAYALRETSQAGRPRGVLFQSSEGIKLTVWVKTWSQIIKENKFRLQFIKEKLEYSVNRDDALQHLRETYSRFTKGVIIDVPEGVDRETF